MKLDRQTMAIVEHANQHRIQQFIEVIKLTDTKEAGIILWTLLNHYSREAELLPMMIDDFVHFIKLEDPK